MSGGRARLSRPRLVGVACAVERGPHAYTVAEAAEAKLGKVGEVVHDLARQPARQRVRLQCLRQVPVVESDVRLDIMRDELVDQPRVELDALFVDAAGERALQRAPLPRLQPLRSLL